MEATRVVTAWDFDGTLSTRDNVVPFLRFAVGNGTFACGDRDGTPDRIGGAA